MKPQMYKNTKITIELDAILDSWFGTDANMWQV